MTSRQTTDPGDQRRGSPQSRRVWARRGGSVLALAALVFAALAAVQALGGPGSLQPAFANATGHCLPSTATKIKDPGDSAVLSAPAGELITGVAIKAGTDCFVTPANAIGTVTFDDCYVIEGLATAEATVRRIGAGPECKDISHIQFVTAAAETGSPESCGDGLDNERDGIVDDGCIGDRAWDDDPDGAFTGNGIQDSGEPGLAGVVFRLFTSDGTLVATTVSDANGTYHFSNVPAGTYFLEADPPPGYQPTVADQGGDDTLDSDFFTGFNRTATFTFPADGSIDHIDAGFKPLFE